MDAADKRMLEREALRNMIQQWNANRLDLFELSEPNENLEFHGVMRFYFQDSGQKIATKCIRVASDATVSDVIETLIEKFRPDMRMLSLGSYSLWETHGPDDERRLEPHEKPLLVQLNWHADDREGRFLLKCLSNNEVPVSEKSDQNFKRKLSKREKKELKKKEKLSRLKSDSNDEKRPVAEKLYTELPETSFTRSISNPEAVMRRRRQQKLERKLQQFRSKDGGPDTGGTLKIYGSSLCPDVPYKTLLLSVGDTAASVVRETLDKYGLSRHDPSHYCIVQVDMTDNSESILEDDECPLAIVMTHPHHSSIMFHVRRRPPDSQPRRRKKKTAGAGVGGGRPGTEPSLVEVAPDGSALENGRCVRITDVVEVGSVNGTALQLYGPSIQPRHCVVAPAEGGGYSITPLHTDALVYVNGRRIMHSQRLQHGSLLKFGRVSTFRFVDPAQENLLNRNLSQSQHFGSGSIYDRSPTSPENSGAMSPTSLSSHQQENVDPNSNNTEEYPRTMSPVSHDTYGYRDGNDMTPYNNNTLKLDNESLMISQHLNDTKEEYIRDEHSVSGYNDQDQNMINRTVNSQYKDNYETTFDLDGNVETKSICSAKSGGSGHDNRLTAMAGSAARPGQEAILPAVLEFPEAGQAQFLAAVITRLDPHAPAFKLAPVYTLYLCARYRASTHYRPELSPTERAHKLTAFLHHVATLIHATVQERCTDSAAQAFWMANASEFLHFLKCDRHISSFSTQAQDLLPTTVQNAFSNLVSCFQEELSRALTTLTTPGGEPAEATQPTLQALAAAMVLLRRCRVNAALTIQLFSHLFHYINAVCFNKLVHEPNTVTRQWGAALSARLGMLAAWAERQGLELAADCHLARTHQAARLIQGVYRTGEEACAALSACFKLNSAQVRALLAPLCAPDVVEAAVAHARALADELCRGDGREITLEESEWLGTGLLIPGDGFSAEVVRGVPPGLAEFVAPLQRGGLCRLAHQPHAIGVWTVYMTGYGAQNRRPPDPRIQIIRLNKNSNGMGLSIVAAKGAGQSKLGIYIKSVVPGGAAAADGRLAAGDQLLSVDGQSLVGITQEKAAELLVRTGPVVTLEVAKQGAVLHGLATLLHQPAYQASASCEVEYEDRMRRNSGTYTNLHPALIRPVSPLTELVTAGYSRRPCHNRCQMLREESTESSTTDESEEFHPQYHGSIPRLIITLDRENNQLQDEMSPDTPGCPLELKCGPPPRPIPIFTFTCEDFDEQHASSATTTHDTTTTTHDSSANLQTSAPESPPPVPEPPANYVQPSESPDGEAVCLPPQMKPIDTKLTLDLFNIRNENEFYRRRCTGVNECVSACDCCRMPQPETQQIPFIDEPAFDPIIFENDCSNDTLGTPKIRRILPQMSIDKSEEVKPETADAVCQTPSSPTEPKEFPAPVTLSPKTPPTPARRKLELNLNIKTDAKKLENMHSRLRRTIFSMSKSFAKSEETDFPSTYSTSESCFETINEKRFAKNIAATPLDGGAKNVLDSVDRKSWKSPDEFRPSFGKVKELTKHFNAINLRYCVKNYKRHSQSSPNLSVRDSKVEIVDNLPNSASLTDLHYESNYTETIDSKGEKLSDDEVKSILIQLEDWSRYGSRGSEDTLTQGNEFELPNLPSEEHVDATVCSNGGYVFNEIVEKKPKKITLDNIRLKSNQSSEAKPSKVSLVKSESLEGVRRDSVVPRVVGVTPLKHSSLVDVSSWRREPAGRAAGSCPDERGAASPPLSPPRAARYPAPSPRVGGGRRASERDLPSRLAAEPVKPSKSTPALHHAVSPPQQHTPAGPLSPGGGSATSVPAGVSGGAGAGGAGAAAWPHKSRSSHNLSHPQQDTFYQNLAAVHSHQALQNRWSSLRSSTGTRPQSAHFTAGQAEQPPESPLLHQATQNNAMSARAAKLAEMSEEVTRRQQQQLQQYQQNKMPAVPPQQGPPTQHHHLMPQNQLHHQHHMMNSQQHLLSQSQQMLNQSSGMMSPPSQQHQQTMSPGQQHHQMLSSSQQHQQMLSQSQQQLLHQAQANHQMSSQSGPMYGQSAASSQPQYMSQPSHQQYAPQSPQPAAHHSVQSPPTQGYHAHHTPQHKYEWHPPGPPSPQRSQPPVAPKPQNVRRPENDMDEQMYHQQQQQQLTGTVQPEDERYVATALEPPAVSLYPAGSGGSAGRMGPPPHNPWQREELERQAEARRQHARARRDATIAQLLALGASRTPVQNQQLRALQLERDFERRATQQHQVVSPSGRGNGRGRAMPTGTRLPPENPFTPKPASSPDDLGTEGCPDEEERSSPEPIVMSPPAASQTPAAPTDREAREPHHPHPQPPPPKSILKTNRTDLTNGYASASPGSNALLTLQTSDNLSESSQSGDRAPPPPPERGSSFAVMASHARALSPPHPPPPHPAHAPLHAATSAPAPVSATEHEQPQHSPAGSGRDKRVSFHERAAVSAAAPAHMTSSSPPLPPASSPPPLHDDAPSQHHHREDPDRFIEEAESMLAGPASPSTPTAATPAHTPGVIGAQEVYRDPRARRLAEREARAAPAPVPEQLSFKEKMKMFALESGEPSTPKDKVKISRAQRDIDAVH